MMSNSTASDTEDTLADEKVFEDAWNRNEKDIEEGNLPDPLEKETLAKKQSKASRSRSRQRSSSLQLSQTRNESETSQNSNDSPVDDDKAFEVQFEGDDDPMSPRSFPTLRKWLIVITVCLSSACVYEALQFMNEERYLTCIRTCTSSLYTMTYGQLTEEFGVSRVVATLGLSLFVFGLGIGPMFLGTLPSSHLHPPTNF